MNHNPSREKAWRYFRLHEWSVLRQVALRRAMLETVKKNEFWDWNLVNRICKRFRCGAAFSFYAQTPHLYWS